MSTFKDSADREWRVKVTVDVIERVREIGVDLCDISGAAMQQLFTDEVLLVRALWLTCEPQANTLGVTAAQFGESMYGDPLEDAFHALREAVEVFFPPLKRGFWKKAVQEMMDEHAETLKLTLEELQAVKVQGTSLKLKRAKIRKAIKKALTQSSAATSSRGSSGLTRGQKRSGNSTG